MNITKFLLAILTLAISTSCSANAQDNGVKCTELRIFKADNGLYGYMDFDENILIPAEYIYADDFSDDLAAVSIDGRLFGYINTSGKTVISFKYTSAFPFVDGIAKVNRDPNFGTGGVGDWVFINKNGKKLFNRKFAFILTFSEGYAAVMLSGNLDPLPPGYTSRNIWSFIDTSGKLATDKEFEDAKSFEDGYAAVRLDYKWGLIDTNFEVIVACEYDAYEEAIARKPMN